MISVLSVPYGRVADPLYDSLCLIYEYDVWSVYSVPDSLVEGSADWCTVSFDQMYI